MNFFYVRSKFSCVRSSHDLCARVSHIGSDTGRVFRLEQPAVVEKSQALPCVQYRSVSENQKALSEQMNERYMYLVEHRRQNNKVPAERCT